MEGKSYYGAMEFRRKLEAGGSLDSTGKKAPGKPTTSQDSDVKVPSILE